LYPDLRVGQGRSVTYNPDMYAFEKSDTGVVPVKESNKSDNSEAEIPEERPVTKGKFCTTYYDLYPETGGIIVQVRQNTQSRRKR